jgi:hypothetical protein
MWNIDPIQIQQCYEKIGHIKGMPHTRGGGEKKEVRK